MNKSCTSEQKNNRVEEVLNQVKTFNYVKFPQVIKNSMHKSYLYVYLVFMHSFIRCEK